MITRFFILCIVVVFYGCSELHFDKSMPVANKPIPSFDKALRGKYLLLDTVLKFKEELFYNTEFFQIPIDKDSFNVITAFVSINEKYAFYSVETNSYYKRGQCDTARIAQKHRKEQKIIQNGYTIFKGAFSDTLIALNHKDILKSNGNLYYLNRFITKKDWDVCQLFLIDNVLSLNLINENDKKILEDRVIIKELPVDIVRLSDYQFNEFVKKGGFRKRYRFKRIIL